MTQEAGGFAAKVPGTGLPRAKDDARAQQSQEHIVERGEWAHVADGEESIRCGKRFADCRENQQQRQWDEREKRQMPCRASAVGAIFGGRHRPGS